MIAQQTDYPSEAAITPEGSGYRVSVIRRGRVESYLCETEAEARRFADLISQPPVETKPRRKPAEPTGLRLVRSPIQFLKPRP